MLDLNYYVKFTFMHIIHYIILKELKLLTMSIISQCYIKTVILVIIRVC